jgi:UPF0176 protein
VNTILNISAYLFVSIDNVDDLKLEHTRVAKELELKGTVLLSPEGINLFVAGLPERIHAFVDFLKSDPRFSSLTPKESWSAVQPFKKLIVKIRNEIIRMNHPLIRPENGRAPSVSAKKLQEWLTNGVDDQGREVVSLDTRNGFEVDYGRFKNAIDWRIRHFTQFPEQAKLHIEELKDKTIVSYCTGGIRCEKAAILLSELGHPNVYQLEGGILKYFEEVGADQYEGDCFVFDERIALKPNLEPIKAPNP